MSKKCLKFVLKGGHDHKVSKLATMVKYRVEDNYHHKQVNGEIHERISNPNLVVAMCGVDV